MFKKFSGCLLVDVDADEQTSCKDTCHHGPEHVAHLAEIQIADIAVTDDVHQVGNRFHHLHNVCGCRRQTVKTDGHRFHKLRKVGRNDPVKKSRQFGDSGDSGHAVGDVLLHGFLHGIAPDCPFYDADNLFRSMVKTPFFLESTLAACGFRLGPVYVKQGQAVEEQAAFQVGLLAQVKCHLLYFRRERNTQAFLLPFHVNQERDFGYRFRHFAQTVAHDERFPDELQQHIVPEAHYGGHRLVVFLKRRGGQSTQRSCRLRQTDCLDYVGHRDVHVLLPQKGRYTADPPGAVIFRMMPQVMIPSRRVYAGPVTAAEGEPVIRPRNPRAFRLYLREPFQQLVVILHLRHILQCRDMPCPADYGYAPERFLLGRSYHATHPRFTDKVPAGGMFRESFPERGHSFLDGLEDAAAVSALFYVHVPPRFTVSIAGSFCQQVKRITRLFNSFIIRFYRLVAILPFRFEGKGMGKREIEEA